MKRIIKALVIGFIVFSLASVSVKPIIISLAKNAIGAIFKGSSVSVAKCEFKPFSQLKLSDLEIKREGVYGIKLGQIHIQYDVPSILKGKVGKVRLLGIGIKISLPKEKIADLPNYLNIQSKGLFLVESIDLEVDSLDAAGLYLKNAILYLAQSRDGKSSSYIQEIRYDKLSISDIQGMISLEGQAFSLGYFSARFIEGEIRGKAEVALDKGPFYRVDLEFVGLDINRLINDLKLNEKVEMTGKINGKLSLEGSGSDFKVVSGDFSTLESGGVLVIKDDSFLKEMASRSNQPLDILVESFKNYHYNTGTLKLGFDRGDLVTGLVLDGKQGRRSLNIVLHNFKL